MALSSHPDECAAIGLAVDRRPDPGPLRSEGLLHIERDADERASAARILDHCRESVFIHTDDSARAIARGDP